MGVFYEFTFAHILIEYYTSLFKEKRKPTLGEWASCFKDLKLP
tara:strand:+ start:77 stop:205 length:129 start_codon:yes stop_codon:yes gene_type:complete